MLLLRLANIISFNLGHDSGHITVVTLHHQLAICVINCNFPAMVSCVWKKSSDIPLTEPISTTANRVVVCAEQAVIAMELVMVCRQMFYMVAVAQVIIEFSPYGFLCEYLWMSVLTVSFPVIFH